VGLGSEEDVLARVGSLQTVTWELLSEDDEDVDMYVLISFSQLALFGNVITNRRLAGEQ